MYDSTREGNEEVFSKNEIDYSIYEGAFERLAQYKIYGEATPIYLYWEQSCKRIWEYNKDIKLIALLRNPIDRAFSGWNMNIKNKNEVEPFMYCIDNERIRIKQSLPYQHRIYSYCDRGLYAEQIRRYRRYFNDEQLLFIKYEEFKSNQKEVLERIFKFLNVDSQLYSFEQKNVFEGFYQYQLNSQEREKIKPLFKNDILEVERLLNWNCEDWLK